MKITHRGIVFYICGWEPNAPDRCEQCGKLDADMRPLGHNGQWICRDCGSIDQELTVNRYKRLMSDADIIVTTGNFNSESTEHEVRSYLEDLYNSKPDHFDDGTFH